MLVSLKIHGLTHSRTLKKQCLVQVGHLSQDSTFDLFEFLSIIFFSKFKFPNSGCSLSVSAAYMPVFTVTIKIPITISFQHSARTIQQINLI